jgi:uncharacterized protein YndB with AHSA1/START domain
MAQADELRVVRIETELRFRATPERLFQAVSQESLKWFPATYGEERTQRIVLEPHVGGAHYEDWGEGRGWLYGQVTVYDPPRRLAVRGRIMPGTINDTEYTFEPDGEQTVMRVSRVILGPISDEDAAGIQRYGDIANFEAALRAVVEDGA